MRRDARRAADEAAILAASAAVRRSGPGRDASDVVAMPPPLLRTLYLGLPLGALALDGAGFRPAVVAVPHRDAPGLRRLRRRLGRRGTLILHRPDLGDASVLAAIRSARPEAVLSWFWPRRIPPHVLALGPRGAFGTHPSLLPRWRGPDPYFHAIRAGDPVTGVTLHRLDAELDTGAIVERVPVAIDPGWHAWDLARALDGPALALLVRCATRLAAGEVLPGRPQRARPATAAPRPDDDALEVDWTAPADAIVRLVRAAAPEPGAAARLGDTWVEILSAAAHDAPLPPGLAPGEAVRGPALVVKAGHGAVRLAAVRLPDGAVRRGAAVAALVPTR